MKNQAYPTKFVVIVLALSLLLAACGANAGSAVSASAVMKAQAAAAAPLGKAVALEALAGQTAGRTITLAKVYQQPDTSSRVVNVLPPTEKLSLMGRSEDGRWLAVAAEGKSQEPAGWIASAEVSVAVVYGETRTLAKVYQQPDASSRVIDVLTPSRQVEVLGRSAGSSWIAIRSLVAGQNATGYVSRADLQLAGEMAETISLTKAHQKPEQGSRVVDVLVPAQKVAIIGRSADGAWVAIASEDAQEFKGWVPAGEIERASDAGE